MDLEPRQRTARAGFDKRASLVRFAWRPKTSSRETYMTFWEAIGFTYVTIGAVITFVMIGFDFLTIQHTVGSVGMMLTGCWLLQREAR